MKHINFIKAPSPQSQQHTHRWFLFSLITFGTMTLVISYHQILQLWTLAEKRSACVTAEQECCNSPECLETHRTYAEQTRTINQKLHHLLNIRNSLQRVAHCIHDITNVPNSMLTQCDITQNKATVSLDIPQQEAIQQLTHTLSQTEWAQRVSLESIHATQPDSTRVMLSINLKT